MWLGILEELIGTDGEQIRREGYQHFAPVYFGSVRSPMVSDFRQGLLADRPRPNLRNALIVEFKLCENFPR